MTNYIRIMTLLTVIISSSLMIGCGQAFAFTLTNSGATQQQHQQLGAFPRTGIATGSVSHERMGDGCTSGLLQKRKIGSFAFISLLLTAAKPALASANIISSVKDLIVSQTATTTSTSFQLTRILFLRMLAIVYMAAFSVAKFQNKGLIGDNGILPARNVLDIAEHRAKNKARRRKEWVEERKAYTSPTTIVERYKNKFLDSKVMDLFREKFWYRTDGMERPLPTLLWLANDRNKLNPWLDGLANIGLFLSTIMLATGSANALLILGLYVIQRSFMSVGSVFYGFGWEPQLAELTFHTFFLVPLLSMDPFFGPVPKLVIWASRFYLFKIMIGAGLIKVKSSDIKWKPGKMSAMDYFYETQPVPNPFSRFFHNKPKPWHRFEVWSNHFVELVSPFLLLIPWRSATVAGGLIQIMFQMILISSGNLSFLNWLTLTPAILCLDDAFLVNKLPSVLQKVVLGTPSTQSFIQSITSGAIGVGKEPIMRTLVSIAFVLTMAKLNAPVVRNLFAKRQIMNGSFDPLRLAGTYGAFGVVAEQRDELIIESANDVKGPWKEYHFKVKPGDVYRHPKWISPYHYRLDWQLWIASQTGSIERNAWLVQLLLKLLRQEKDVMDLLDSDPWEAESQSDSTNGENNCPKYIRIEKYRYQFYNHKRDANENESNEQAIKQPFWKRERIGRYFPRQGVVTADILEEIVNY